MCAIAGIIGMDISLEVIQKMLFTMIHRGPDEQGFYNHDHVFLLHARLAIIDKDGGTQPMMLEWEGERFIIVYNGEIYNTDEVRTDLIKAGHRFKGYSDTEVVLHAYAHWGKECVNRLNGIFAFAVYEEGSKRLFLARDRIGVKPLFYKHHHNGVIFASEIKTILSYPDVRAQLDVEGAAQLLLFGPGRMPGSGVFYGIHELEPGWCGYIQDNKFTPCCYWRLRDKEHTDNLEQTSDKVRFLVTEAIQSQMISDSPVGTFLSGGLDSSLITAVCADVYKSRGIQLQSFSVDYADNDLYFTANKFQPNSDGAYIRKMVEAFRTDHHWSILSTEDLLDVLDVSTIARDLPGMADVDFSLLAFCRDVRQHVRVALSGECADEIFGGYPWYRDPEIRSVEGFPWAQNTAQRVAMLHPDVASKVNGHEYIMDAYLKTCRESDILPGNNEVDRRMKEMMNLNFRWFMQTLLDRKDRMSMHSSLEVRVPFCDYRVAEYMYSVPWKMKDYQGQEKGLLRYAMRGLLPDEILFRKKSPYPKTWDPKYRELVCRRVEDLLNNPREPIFAVVNPEAVKQLLNSEPAWPWYGQLMRVPQTLAYLLQVNLWLKHYDIALLF